MGLIYGSVCSGIEAATVAWRPLGWRPSFFSEIEAFPRAVLDHHYPAVPLHGDFTTIQAGDYDPIDLLVGGTPCQSFSIAGLRGGLADDRGNLALEYLRLADRLRPRWLVWENVPGVLSSGGGRDFGAVLGGMVELGYGWAYRVLDAQYFGVPQRRRRVFVVGHLGDWRRAAAVLFERHSLQGHSAPSREAGAATAGALSASLGRRCGVPDGGDTEGQLIASTLRARDGAKGVDSDCTDTLIPIGIDGSSDISHALTASHTATGRLDPSMQTFVTAEVTGTMRSNGDAHSGFQLGDGLIAHSLRGEGFDASKDGTGRGTPLVPVMPFDTTQLTSPSNRSNPRYGDPCHGLSAKAHAPAIAFPAEMSGTQCAAAEEISPALSVGHTMAVAFQSSQSGMRLGGDVHPTLDSNNGSRRHHGVMVGSAVRRLTTRECERLQGFPDDYTLVPYRGKPAADGPRYKALGNSMAVPCMRWIGERIRMVEAIGLSGECAA